MMGDDWVLDVLSDLRTFARQNAFSALAEQLDDTIIVAASDIHRGSYGTAGRADDHEGQAGNAYHRAGIRELPR